MARLKPGEEACIGVTQWCASVAIFLACLGEPMLNPACCLLQRPAAVVRDLFCHLGGSECSRCAPARRPTVTSSAAGRVTEPLGEKGAECAWGKANPWIAPETRCEYARARRDAIIRRTGLALSTCWLLRLSPPISGAPLQLRGTRVLVLAQSPRSGSGTL